MGALTTLAEMPAAEYFDHPGLSFSGMKDLAISPLRYWYMHINPNRPEPRETPEMRFGSALHCAVLEPERFEREYEPEAHPSLYDGCLVTMDDLRTWCKSKGIASSAKTKLDLIERVLAHDPNAPIFDLIKERQLEGGKRILSQEDWKRVQDAANSLRSSRWIQEILNSGTPESCLFVSDPETGIWLKCRMDWATPTITLDLKTFTANRGKSIEKSISDAIYYEGYYRQAYFYTMLRKMASPEGRTPAFVFAFVESEQPHEVRIKRMQPDTLYWDRARMEIRELIHLYCEYAREFGDKPWIREALVEPLYDEDVRQLAY